jgi:uncharacterized hydrophobic protein (TIGR00271 family)
MADTKIKTYFIYDEKAFQEVDDSVKTLIKEKFDCIESLQQTDFNNLNEDCKVALFVEDHKVNPIIIKAHQHGFSLGFTPHPEAKEVMNSYNVSEEIEDAIAHFLEVDQLVDSDLLFCNDKLINNYMVIGDIITEITKKGIHKSAFQKLNNFIQFMKRINHIHPKSVEIEAHEQEKFETASAGILITQHAKNAVISRIVLENSYLNDGLFHSLIFSPRSFTKVVFSYLKMKFSLQKKEGTSHLSFLGHIKTNQLKIKYQKKESCTIDGEMIEAKEFNIKINGSFKLVPSKDLLYTEEEKGNHRVFKVSQLPKGKELVELLSKKLPFIKHASTSEFKELFTTLRDNATTKSSYLILMVLSTVLATFGLFANSNPIIIGAMILAPLISPVISLSMGTLRQDKSLIKNSMVTIGWGLLLSYLSTILLTLITPIYAINSEISSRLEPNLLDLGVAVVSGAAGAYAHANANIAKTLAGVAIAVALIPPLAVSGIGIGWGDWDVFIGAFLLLITNLTGMVLSGAFTFLLMGFSPFKIAKKGLLISLIIVLTISIPLGYGFYQVVKENRIVNSINQTKVNELLIKNVKIVDKEPLKLYIVIVAKAQPSNEELTQVKSEIEKRLNRKVDLEIDVYLER